MAAKVARGDAHRLAKALGEREGRVVAGPLRDVLKRVLRRQQQVLRLVEAQLADALHGADAAQPDHRGSPRAKLMAQI